MRGKTLLLMCMTAPMMRRQPSRKTNSWQVFPFWSFYRILLLNYMCDIYDLMVIAIWSTLSTTHLVYSHMVYTQPVYYIHMV